MITYNPKDWFKLIFHFHKSDTFRILLPNMLVLGFLTTLACYLETKYIINAPNLTIFHQICGFIISLVLVFRINTAYDRWWEGRKLWGSLINNARNLAIKVNVLLPKDDLVTRELYLGLLTNFPFSLKEHLRNNPTIEDIQFSSVLSQTDYVKASHKPNLIASRLQQLSLDIAGNHSKSQNDYLVLSETLVQFTDICGACERIKNTPIPYSYSMFIKKIIFVYIITMPVSFGLYLGYWAVPIVMIIFYAFASLEVISEEVEDPFGTDSNDLPTDEISVRIKNNVREILLENGN